MNGNIAPRPIGWMFLTKNTELCREGEKKDKSTQIIIRKLIPRLNGELGMRLHSLQIAHGQRSGTSALFASHGSWVGF